MKYIIFSQIVLLILTSLGITLAQESAALNEEIIRKVREKSNQAIKTQKVDEAISYTTDDINIVASSGQVLSGKIAFEKALLDIFGNNPELYFIRKPEEIKLHPDGTMAWEKGTWVGTGPKTVNWKDYGGSYAASWQKADGEWKIRSELFVRLY